MKKFLTLFISLFLSAQVFAAEFDLEAKLKLAEKGDANAMNEIGEYAADGGGGKFPPPTIKAITWWDKGREKGNRAAYK